MTLKADVIVVGAGSAGSIVARRLVDAGYDVVLAEAGGEDSNPAIHDVLRLAELWMSPQDWGYHTVAQKNAASRQLHLPRGKVLGGSHALNAAIWVRGCVEDFEHWQRLGAPQWGWDDVSAVYDRIEAYDGPTTQARGLTGPLDVTVAWDVDPIQQSILDASVQAGLELNPDYNRGRLDGVAKMQFTIRGRERWNTYKAYLKPVRGQDNLRVVTGARVNRLIIEGSRVLGVEMEVEGVATEVYAERDHPVRGGAGLAPGPAAKRSGPGRGAARPGSGGRPGPSGRGPEPARPPPLPVIFETQPARSAPRHRGCAAAQTHHFWRSRAGLDAPDTQPINFSVPLYSEDVDERAGVRILTDGRPGATREPGVGDPDRTRSRRPRRRSTSTFSTTTGTSTSWSPRCASAGRSAGSPLSRRSGARASSTPVRALESDEELRDYVRRTAITYHHQVGTCAMGEGPDAVVDPGTLRVRGLDGVRVADASVFPRISSGNTNAPACMVGERAADFVLADRA